MVHFCEMMMSLEVVFDYFKIFILCVIKGGGGGGVKGKKMVQNEKNYLCHLRYLRNDTSYDFDL